MRRRFRVPVAIVAACTALATSTSVAAQEHQVAVMFGPEDELAAKRLVGELGAMDLRAELVSGGQSTAPAVVRFLARDRVSILCCGLQPNERQLEIIRDADPSLLALRTAERLRAQGLGRPPPADTFYTVVKAPPPPPPRGRWLTLRAGAGVLAPSPSFGPGALFTVAGSLWLFGPLALTVVGHGTLSSPEHRVRPLWIESTPTVASGGITYVRAAGRLSLLASAYFTYVRSPFRYRVGDAEERRWLRQRFGPGVGLTGFARVGGPLSLFADLTVAYMPKDPSVSRSQFREGEAFAPSIAATCGVAWTFADVMTRGADRSSSAR